MLSFKVDEMDTRLVRDYLQHAVAPRPICFASTINKAGEVNLSPFSFFNMFSTRPPVCVFSPSRRYRDNTNKHTLENILEVPEVVINIVDYSMVHQTSLSSTEYPKGVNEFAKSGLTELASELVRPPRVKESPVQLECRVRQVIPLAETGGAGNLVIADVVMIHVQERILDENQQIDQAKMDLVARLGGSCYCRITADSLFEVAKPFGPAGMGVDQLPASVRQSTVLTGNHLGQLANVEKLPARSDAVAFSKKPEIKELLGRFADKALTRQQQLHHAAAILLAEGNTEGAWKLLLME